jgi:phenylacetate-CoA ligase
MRDTFRRVYKCETFDGYGSVEACGLITNCEFGTYHISPDIGIVELLDKEGNPTKPGEIGEIVSTGLLNYDQPLIRYRIGDLAVLSKNQMCKCGINLPIIDEIIGRFDDIVTLRDGRQLSSFNRFFANVSGIGEVQVIQLDFEVFQLKIVSDGNFNETSKSEILEAFKVKLGNVQVDIELVPEIPRGPNGKFKAVISKIGYYY